MKHKNNIGNGINSLYKELNNEDRAYGSGGKKIKKVRTDVHKKREMSNLKKSWEQHTEDYEEVDDFFGD